MGDDTNELEDACTILIDLAIDKGWEPEFLMRVCSFAAAHIELVLKVEAEVREQNAN